MVAVKPAEVKGSGTIWQGATFGGDQDGKMTAKFKRLMGIKNVEKGTVVFISSQKKIFLIHLSLTIHVKLQKEPETHLNRHQVVQI